MDSFVLKPDYRCQTWAPAIGLNVQNFFLTHQEQHFNSLLGPVSSCSTILFLSWIFWPTTFWKYMHIHLAHPCGFIIYKYFVLGLRDYTLQYQNCCLSAEKYAVILSNFIASLMICWVLWKLIHMKVHYSSWNLNRRLVVHMSGKKVLHGQDGQRFSQSHFLFIASLASLVLTKSDMNL